jgi:hypothetical protein
MFGTVLIPFDLEGQQPIVTIPSHFKGTAIGAWCMRVNAVRARFGNQDKDIGCRLRSRESRCEKAG